MGTIILPDVITVLPPVCQCLQCPGQAHSVCTPHPYIIHKNCTKELCSVRTEPSAMICPRHSGNSELLTTDSVTALFCSNRISSRKPDPVSGRLSHISHSMPSHRIPTAIMYRVPTVTGSRGPTCSPTKLFHPCRESMYSLSQLLLVLCPGSLSTGSNDVDPEGGGEHSTGLSGHPAPWQCSRDSKL